MTVHMFRVYLGPGNTPLSQIETQLNGWMNSNPEWEGDNVSHVLRRQQSIETGAEYYALDVRFLPASGKANIQQALESRLQGQVAWYRVGYHQCTHREGDGSSGPCDWADSTEWSASGESVPQGVPTFDTG